MPKKKEKLNNEVFIPLIIESESESEYGPTEDQLLNQFAKIIADIYLVEMSRNELENKEPDQESLF